MKLRFVYRAWRARFRDQRLEIALIRALVRPGDFVVDVGANKGAYVYWLRGAVGRTGAVFAYEPQPPLAAYLRRACETFRWTNVAVHELALSNHAGSSMLHVPGTGSAPGASLESAARDAPGRAIECRLNTLDAELEGRAPLRFLKVDVEGHELAVFQGAERTLDRFHPPILFECEERHLGSHSMADVFSHLERLGYQGFLLLDKALLPVARFEPKVHQRRHGRDFWKQRGYHNNFLFVERGFQLDRISASP